MPPKVCFMQLSSCWGCHQSLIDDYGADLVAVLTSIDIVYFPAVVDFKLKDLEALPDNSVDIGFVEGCPRTTDDLHELKLTRQKSKVLVALGSCACFGGIPSLANLYTKEELIDRKYNTAETIVETKGYPEENVPGILDRVPAIHEVVDVDIWIPGCPPITDHLVAAFKYILSLPAAVPSDKNICDICNLRGDKCLLNKGILCFGSLSSATCELKCPNKGEVCYGCTGATKNIAKAEAKKLVELVSTKTLSEQEVGDILKFVILYAKIPNLGYMYVKGDPLQALGHKKADYSVKTVEGNIKAFDLSGYPEEIGVLLYAVGQSDHFKYTEQTVCATCPRNKENKKLKGLKRDYEGGVKDQEECLLEQGYLCMGIVTKGGCGALCIKANCPCLGCYGPSPNLADAGGKFATSIASMATAIGVPDLAEKIPDPAGQFYRFMTSVSPFKKKQNDSGM
ncbi:MAG: hypothetical protein ACTSPY_16955 [Candidatus Helarchaeota archaeon]